jgi:ABC-type sugar transport system permease subunit
MADIAMQPRTAKRQIREATAWDQLRTNRNWLGFWFMMPAMAFLIFFLAYPLGLGVWISFTDAKIGRPGEFIGVENYEWLWGDTIPFVAITLLAGLQTVQPSLYEAATLDGASKWEMFRFITYPLLTPIIAVVMTFSVLFTFTDFQLIWAMTRGGPVNATHLMATLSYQRAIIAGQLGEGAAISSAMIPFLLAAIMVSWFGLQRRKWQQGENND